MPEKVASKRREPVLGIVPVQDRRVGQRQKQSTVRDILHAVGLKNLCRKLCLLQALRGSALNGIKISVGIRDKVPAVVRVEQHRERIRAKESRPGIILMQKGDGRSGCRCEGDIPGASYENALSEVGSVRRYGLKIQDDVAGIEKQQIPDEPYIRTGAL
jgi:hypothetical protein